MHLPAQLAIHLSIRNLTQPHNYNRILVTEQAGKPGKRPDLQMCKWITPFHIWDTYWYEQDLLVKED